MSELEVIIMGSGGSSMVPELRCVIQQPDPTSNDLPCKTCTSTIDADGNILPDEKNRRGNVSGLFRKTAEDGSTATILIDVGKSFVQNSLKYFRKYGVSRIDAVLLTHEHADAIMGLGDLRHLTMEGSIQEHVDIYCDARTLEVVGNVFPYCVPGKWASGSGVLGQMRWHILEQGVAFKIGSIEILPLAVQHGTNTIEATIPSPPSCTNAEQGAGPSIGSADTPPLTPVEGRVFLPGSKRVPYMVFSYLVDREVFYCSDTNCIPAETWNRLLYPDIPKGEDDQTQAITRRSRQYSLLLLDLDMWTIHPARSHLSLAEHLRIAADFGAAHTISIGMGHDIEYEEYLAFCRGLHGDGRADMSSGSASTWLQEHIELWQELAQRRLSVRPGYDGMRLRIKDGQVTGE